MGLRQRDYDGEKEETGKESGKRVEENRITTVVCLWGEISRDGEKCLTRIVN